MSDTTADPLPEGYTWDKEDMALVLHDPDGKELGSVACANVMHQAYVPDDEWPIGESETEVGARYLVELRAGLW
jgi:hypothetical protein